MWKAVCGLHVEKKGVVHENGLRMTAKTRETELVWTLRLGVLLMALFVGLMSISWDLHLTREGMKNMASWLPLGCSSQCHFAQSPLPLWLSVVMSDPVGQEDRWVLEANSLCVCSMLSN